MRDCLDPYAVLGVGRDATSADVRRAYRRTAWRIHPDVAGQASDDMALANEAWFVLRDPARRAAHDARIGAEEAPVPGTASAEHAEPSSPERAMRLLRAFVAVAVLLFVTVLFLILFVGNTQGPTALP